MRMLMFVGVSVACAVLMGIGGLRAAGCDPVGPVRFVCNQVVPRISFSCREENGCSRRGWWRMERSV
jgi:hypothetical protein